MENKEEEQEIPERVLNKRRRNVLLLMIEVAFCLILGIGAVMTKRTVAAVRNEALSDDVYTENIYSGTRKEVRNVTDAEGNVVSEEEVDIPVYTAEGKYRNFLILGVDREEYNTDVIIIASLNNETGEVRMVSILRDTVLPMEGSTRFNKANSQYANGGISATVSQINRCLGLDIKEYAVMNWRGVAMCINQLGGIEMTIENDRQLRYFNGYLSETNDTTDIWAPQLKAPGTYIMSGTQVVALCRIRYGGLNDNGRTNNQRIAISRILEKAKSTLKSGDVNTLLNVAETALGNVKTNLKLPEIVYLATSVNNYKVTESAQFPLSYTSGESTGNFIAKYGSNLNWGIVANDFAGEVKAVHEFLFDDPNYEPSEFVRQTSYQLYLDRTGQ